ncbi:MAG: serine/threonine protein kinase, partial [Myxococcaceae bacterium]|nr:serine/threonine protein kinase [Myxococcaceae bacterium]
TLLGELLDRGGKTLSNEDRSELLLKLGGAREKLAELDRAAAAYSSASELAPNSLAALTALGDVQEKQGNWDALSRTLRRRLEQEESKEARFSLMVRIGDAYLQLKDRNQAARFYVSALELEADDRNLLSKQMAVYSESKDWSRLVEVLVRMASVVEEPRICAKYLYTAAGIALTELDNVEDAIEYYETSLGFDASLDVAFKGLVESLTKAGAWDRLANAYRAQLERRREGLDNEQQAALWDTLGAIYLERLHRLDPAVEAYETASELEPDNRARVEQLVELYGRQPSRFADRAIAAHERLLSANPYRVESYRALRKLYTQLQRPDEAWTVCQALRSLNMAEPEEEAFFKRHRVQAPATARECITEDLWQEYVLLAEQDDVLTSMLALIQPAAVQELAQDPEAFGVARDRMVDCEHDNSVMAQMLHYAGGVMLVPLPPVFYRPRDPGGVSFLSTNPPAMGLGQGALRSAPDQALAFIAGRQLSYFRPGHYLRQLVPTGSGLRSWLLAAIKLANPRFPAPEPMREQVDRNVAALARTLHAPQQQALTSLVERLLREQPELDMKRWALAVDLAADRIGFVLANSLDAAVAVVRASPQDSSYASERDRLKALYQYAVSPKYTALRKAIGVTIG